MFGGGKSVIFPELFPIDRFLLQFGEFGASFATMGLLLNGVRLEMCCSGWKEDNGAGIDIIPARCENFMCS